MKEAQVAWPEILSALETVTDSRLRELLDSSALDYDGDYKVSAPGPVYASLCQYYPAIETVVQDLTGKHLQLSLLPSVPMGTLSGGPEDDLRLEIGATNLTEAIIAPESIAAIPSYLLRFVPYVGSSAVLIATALRQAFYRTSRERGADQLYPRAGDQVTINVQSLLNMLGNVISRAKFFRVFKDGGLDWFVRRLDNGHTFNGTRVQRLPNTYHYRGMLLTPGDAQDLYDWLLAQGVQADPVSVLTAALRAPRDHILRFPYRLPDPAGTGLFDQPASTHDVLRRALPAPMMNAAIAGLCDRLAAHLVRPGSFLAVPWYWFRNVLPQLGDDLGMLYLMSKNCCYIDWARGHDRDTFWVPGGLPTLQRWIRSETLPQRIPHAQPSTRGRPRNAEIKPESAYTRDWREENRALASQYLCRMGTRAGANGTDWHLRVNEVQLTPAHETLKQALYAFLYAPPAPLQAEMLALFARDGDFQALALKNAQAHPDRLCHFETLVQDGICQNETLDAETICQFDTLVDGINCYFETLVSSGLCNFDTVLNILYRVRNSNFFSQYSSTPDTGTAGLESEIKPGVVGHFKDGAWDFTKILAPLNPLLREKIHSQGAEKRFLAWLIYASLAPAIKSPVNLAVTRTISDHTNPGGPADRLAHATPAELAAALNAICQRREAGYLGAVSGTSALGRDLDGLLEAAESGAEKERLARRLRDALGIEDKV